MKRLRIAFVLFLVLALVTTPMTGTAVAIEESNECDPIDKAVWLLSLGIYNDGDMDPDGPLCDPVELYDEAKGTIDSIKENEAQQDALSVYQAGLAVEQDLARLRSESENEQLDGRTIAFMKYQAAVENKIANNATKAEAKTAGNQAVADYITRMEIEYLLALEQKFIQVHTLETASTNQSLATDSMQYHTDTNVNSPYSLRTKTTGVTYTLENGSTVSLETLSASVSGSNTSIFIGADGSMAGDADSEQSVQYGVSKAYIEMPSADGSNPSYTLVNLTKHAGTYGEYGAIATDAKANGDTWTESIWGDVTNDTYEAGSAGSCLTLASQYSQDYDRTGGGVYAAGTLACSGYESVNMTEVGSMTISVGGTNYSGYLLSQNAPPGGVWEAGTTYDASLIGGAQVFATVSGDLIQLDDAGPLFTIEEIRARDGSTLNQTAPQEFVYQTTTNEAFKQQMDELDALVAAIEALEPVAGGGTGSGSGTNQLLLLVAGIFAIAMLLYGKSSASGGSGGGGRRGRR